MPLLTRLMKLIAQQLYLVAVAGLKNGELVKAAIPTSMKNCSSLYSFKRHLKSHLIAQLIDN